MRKIAMLLAAALVSIAAAQVPALAGDDDADNSFGTRYSAGIDKKITKGLHVFAEEEVRVNGDFSSLDRMYTSAGISYKICPYLKVGAGYTAINAWREDSEGVKSWDWRHRGTADITGMIKEGGWKFSLRERFQATYKTREVSEYEQPQTALALKSRFKVSYDIPKTGLSPYVSIEHRLALNGAKWDDLCTDETNFRNSEYIGLKDIYTSRLRSQFGLQWEMSKRNALELYFLYDNITDRNIDCKKSRVMLKEPVTTTQRNFMAVGLGYTFSF